MADSGIGASSPDQRPESGVLPDHLAQTHPAFGQAAALTMVAVTGDFAAWAPSRCCSATAQPPSTPRCSPPSWMSPTPLAVPRRRCLPAVARRALLSGVLADLAGVAALTAASGLLAWARMYETHPRSRGTDLPPRTRTETDDIDLMTPSVRVTEQRPRSLASDAGGRTSPSRPKPMV